MLTRAIVGLLAVAVATAVIAAYRPVASASGDPVAVAPPAFAPLPPATASDPSSLVAAPLFNARRTFAPEPIQTAVALSPPSPPPDVVGLIRTSLGGSFAVVRDGSGQKLLTRGGTIEGWTLVAIERDAALFARGPERARARLRFGSEKAKADGITASTPAAVAPTAEPESAPPASRMDETTGPPK